MIRVNYESARRQARELDQAALDCQSVQTSLKRIDGMLPENWNGASADMFTSLLQQQISQAKKLEDDMERLADVIREVADRFEEAERRLREAMAAERAAKAAAQGSSGGGSK